MKLSTRELGNDMRVQKVYTYINVIIKKPFALVDICESHHKKKHIKILKF